MKLTIVPDKINPYHSHVFLNKFEVASIFKPYSYPEAKQIYTVYTFDDPRILKDYKTFEECIKYIEDYLDG